MIKVGSVGFRSKIKRISSVDEVLLFFVIQKTVRAICYIFMTNVNIDEKD